MKKIKPTDMEIVHALAKTNLNITKAAELCYMHRNTAMYHISKIELLTGLDPLNVRDLLTLLGYVEKIPCEECRFKEECIRMIETIDGDNHNHHRLEWCSKGERV